MNRSIFFDKISSLFIEYYIDYDDVLEKLKIIKDKKKLG
jgi:hypothetical protein